MLRNLVIFSSGNTYKTNLNEFELREKIRSHNISTSLPLTHRSTANNCHSLAQRQLSLLPNTSHNQPDSPLLQHSSKGNAKKNVQNIQPFQIEQSPKMKIQAIPETVKNFLEDAGLDFHKYNKFKHTQGDH